ncbi:MAG: sialidase, partial [Acinetobacter sp.]
MLKRKIYITLGLLFAIAIAANAQLEKWQKGIVKQEFLYDKAPFPSCHSATIVETPTGLVASYFGGTKERDPDVEIY